MTIFGVALLAFCTLVGVFVGDLLGIVLGVPQNRTDVSPHSLREPVRNTILNTRPIGARP